MRQVLATNRSEATDPLKAWRPAPSAPRAIGNQARLRRLAQPTPGAAFIQPKLKIGDVNDPLEREADQVAEQVMRAPEGGPAVTTAAPAISRKCAACADEDLLRGKSANAATAATGEAPSIVHDVLASSGQPLDASARAFFEPRFGQDFSSVRVHAGEQASASADAIGARAYATGQHLVFSKGEYAPHSTAGRQLLAHELAHVVQQSGADRALRREVGDAPPAADTLQTGGMGAGTGLRTDSVCSGASALPIGETFVPNTTATLYSLPFHAAAGTRITVGLDAELETSGNPALASVGVDVKQCCDLVNSDVTTDQTIGGVGDTGHPAHTPLSVTLPDNCTLSTHVGTDCVYYLRLRIASTLQAVRLSYTVR